MNKMKKASAVALFSTALIGASAVAVPLMNATSITAQASEVDVTLASKTRLDSSYGSPINTTGSHMGTLTVTNNIGAQANILLQTLKSAEIKIPTELANNIKFDDNADVSVQMGINITKIPVLGNLFNSLATGTDNAIKKQLAILVNNPHLAGSNLDKVYAALNALETFQNMDMSNQVSSITVNDGVATAKFNDATVRHFANQIINLLDNLQTAINMVDWGNGLLGSIANPITSLVKPAINYSIDGIRNIINIGANDESLFGNAGIFTSATIKFPVDLDLPMSWFEQYAPNGLTTNFTAGIENPSGISWDLFSNTKEANKDIEFSDIVAPVTPVLSNVKKSSVNVVAEAGSTVTVYNASGADIGSAKVPGAADGKTQASLNINIAEQKTGAKISAKATDASGNISVEDTATVPGEATKPTSPSEQTKPTEPSKPTPPVKTQVVYRVYNPNTGEHFYPTSVYERNANISAGWKDEGILATAPTSGTAVYRVYNPNAKGGDHYYTTSQYEATSLVSKGWQWDNNAKPVFYSGGSKPVYVAYNPNAETGAHSYTTSSYEQNSLLNAGWKFGKTAWFAVK